MKTLRGLIRSCLLICYTSLYAIILPITNALGAYKVHQWLLVLWYGTTLKLLGISTIVRGHIPKNQAGCLVVANHCSYVDILVLGSLMPVHFTPKLSIKSWPIVGFFVTLSQPVYIDRGNRSKMHDQYQKIVNFIDSGKHVVIFPEGTTNNGAAVLPFKAGAFAILEHTASPENPTPVLPITITYTEYNGTNHTPSTPSPIAWFGDMTLMPHLWKMLTSNYGVVEVDIHDTVSLATHQNRKAINQHCHELISTTLTKNLSRKG